MVVLTTFAAIAVLAFAVPLALTIAVGRTQELVIGRSGDADRFADLAETSIVSGDSSELIEEVERYHQLFGESVLVVDSAGADLARTGGDLGDAAVAAAVAGSRRNEPPAPPHRLLPWSPARTLIARPVGGGAQIDGVVVIVASTGAARRDIIRGWTVVAVGAAIALVLIVVLAAWLSRWVLRPLAALSTAVADVTGLLPRPRSGFGSPARRSEGPPEIRSLAVAFDTMALAVAESVDAQRQLVADTAHAMRNPLAALAIRLESLEPSVAATAVTTYRGATAEVDRLTGLLDGLLELAVAETVSGFDPSGAPPVEPECCDAFEIAAERVDAWRDAYTRAGQTLRLRLGDQLDVAVSERVLTQILDVALSNSCRYAGAGAETEVAVRPNRDGVAIDVTDDGTGVTDAEIGLLTTRFFRGSAAAAGGSGLGLPIAAALAKRHHGSLSVEHATPHGLRVRVCLPLVRQ